ncbi:alpha-ketoacid dehydrogenase subunit beta [Streptacidiphilus anmyonensis]|uniref:alpha-ketoacid dehydrogenase subunit beta n=1 Tax=Streptacidiphilus anmyonensis TaxID=405782 RepID=UPI000B2D8C9E|nr:transketolase C-terminal domain-containing protein [Streptacidiphilus anmyonensis]
MRPPAPASKGAGGSVASVGRTRNRSASARADVQRDHRLALLREMVRIRRFEERCVELYSLLALDQILNNAATLLHMSGGQVAVPLVIRMTTGAGRQLAAQHSHSLEAFYAHIPGIRVLAPATLEDARYLLAPALADPDPVVIFEHGSLYNMSGTVGHGPDGIDLDSAAVRRSGGDVSLITYGGSLGKVLEAAERLQAEHGVDAEVVDLRTLRTLRPLDDATLAGLVSRTHWAVVVDEGWRSGGVSAEVAARITERASLIPSAPRKDAWGATAVEADTCIPFSALPCPPPPPGRRWASEPGSVNRPCPSPWIGPGPAARRARPPPVPEPSGTRRRARGAGDKRPGCGGRIPRLWRTLVGKQMRCAGWPVREAHRWRPWWSAVTLTSNRGLG